MNALLVTPPGRYLVGISMITSVRATGEVDELDINAQGFTHTLIAKDCRPTMLCWLYRGVRRRDD